MSDASMLKQSIKWVSLIAGSVAEIGAISMAVPRLYEISLILALSSWGLYIAYTKLPPKKNSFMFILPLVIIGSGVLGIMSIYSRVSEELATYGVKSFGIVTYVETNEAGIRQHGHFIYVKYTVDGVQRNSRIPWRGVSVGDTVVIRYSRQSPEMFEVIR